MKAYLFKKPGKPESIKIHELPEPEPGPGEVRVKVSHIGINYAEILSRKGQYGWAPSRPYIPGMEATGTVDKAGSENSPFSPGDKVIVGWQHGSYAEKMVVPEYMVTPAFPEFSPEENAAYLVNYMTAWVSLFRIGRILPEDKVLINAAAGGVGSAAVKLSKALGCTIYGTAGSAEKVQFLKEQGVKAINYRETDFEEEIKKAGGVDLVLELVGGEVFRKSKKVLNPFGRIVIAGVASLLYNKWNPVSLYNVWKNLPRVNIMKMAQNSHSIGATHIGYLTSNPDLAVQTISECSKYVLKNKIKPVIDKSFAFDQIPEAHKYIENRKNIGKVVIRVSNQDESLNF